MSHEGADAYIKRIGEMQQILTISDSNQQANATFEWALRCFEHPETAWEGKLILIPEFSFEAYKGLYGKSFGKTPTQLRRIKEAVFKIRWLPLMGVDIIAFAAFNSPPNDPKIIRYLLHQLEIVKPENVKMRYEFPFHVWELLRATAFYANKEEALEPLIEKIRKAAYEPRRRKRLIRRFSNEILK